MNVSEIVYDNSYAGFLTAIFKAFELSSIYHGDVQTAPSLVPIKNNRRKNQIKHSAADMDQKPQEELNVETSVEIASRVHTSLRRIAGDEAAFELRDAFLHVEQEKEQALLEYVRLCIHHGPEVLQLQTVGAVKETTRLASCVRKEAHRFYGFVRFQELFDGTLYASIRPEHDILAHLIPHFSERLGGRAWIIHDQGRKVAMRHYDGMTELWEGVSVVHGMPLAGDQKTSQTHWRDYFKSNVIKERSESNLNWHYLPDKYREFLTEMQVGIQRETATSLA